jgi:hypothetical protein
MKWRSHPNLAARPAKLWEMDRPLRNPFAPPESQGEAVLAAALARSVTVTTAAPS